MFQSYVGVIWIMLFLVIGFCLLIRGAFIERHARIHHKESTSAGTIYYPIGFFALSSGLLLSLFMLNIINKMLQAQSNTLPLILLFLIGNVFLYLITRFARFLYESYVSLSNFQEALFLYLRMLSSFLAIFSSVIWLLTHFIWEYPLSQAELFLIDWGIVLSVALIYKQIYANLTKIEKQLKLSRTRNGEH